MQNPLLDFTALPRFAAIRAEHVAPAVDALIAEGNATIERLAAADRAPTWEGFVEPLDDADVDSFFGSSQTVDLDFRVTFFDRLIVVPRGGGTDTIELKVAPK